MPTFKIYQPFDSTDIISGKTIAVSSGFFPGGEISISQSTFTTSSTQAKSTGSGGIYDVLNGSYYTNVYNSSISNPQLLFSVSYGDFDGGGVPTGSIFGNTRAVYSQYKNLLLGAGDQDGKFSFRTGSSASSTYITSSQIYIINFSSDLMKDRIDNGQWTFTISGSNGSSSLSIIDEYPLLTTSEKNEQRLVYQIVSGSCNLSTGQTSSPTQNYLGLGLFYPKNGIIVLNSDKLRQYAGLSYDNTTSSLVVNHRSLVSKMKTNGPVIRVRKTENTPSTHYFVRVKNKDYNFSNNPSFVYQTSGLDYERGEIIPFLQTAPTTYITTIGLYNDMNELLAVAKLSRPTRKDFNNEVLCRIRLDF